MAKLPEDRGTPEQYEETVHPDNPPRASAAPAAATAGMWYVLGPIAIGVLIVVFALWFLFGGDPVTENDDMPSAAPTMGDERPGPTSGSGTENSPDETEDELERRGVDDGSL